MLNQLREDESGFLEQVQWMVNGCVNEYKPSELYVIHIRDFFDYKWCYFSGKIMGAVGISKFCDLTLPPFVPNRVLSQDHYKRTGTNGHFYEASPAAPLHVRQSSEANFKRFIRRTTNDGTVLWYSSGSRMTARGSVMVYNVTSKIKFGWHVTFLKKAVWQIEKVTFSSKALVQSLLDSGSNLSLHWTGSSRFSVVSSRASLAAAPGQ
jgi:hypothetical protein